MSTPFIGEIKLFSFTYAPKGWALCNGQLMPINQNQALFSLLGTTYGGDGRVNFALPDLRGRVPMHFGSQFVLGQRAGEENHTLLISELPAHNHLVNASSSPASVASPANAFWADGGKGVYSPAPSVIMANGTLPPTGGSQPHNNMSPYLVLNFCIALQGIFPSQN
jgi:microcystin-dependent protein